MVNTRRVVGLGALTMTVALAAAVAIELGLQSAAVGPTGTPVPSVARPNPKLEAARRDTPPPAPPTQRPWRAQEASDIITNLPLDANFDPTMRALTTGPEADPRAVGRTPILGAPLFVRGLASSDGDEFVVPVVVDGTTMAIMVVPIGRDGNGQLVATRGWSSATTFPAQTADKAIAAAGLTGQPAVRAELVWTTLRGLADEMSPFWRIERAGRAVNYIFEDGTVVSASDLGIE